MRACEKTQVEERQIEAVVNEIEAELQQRVVREVSSAEIIKLALQQLRSLSEVAYIRYASIYCRFAGIQDFVGVVEELHKRVELSEPSVEPTPSGIPEIDAIKR